MICRPPISSEAVAFDLEDLVDPPEPPFVFFRLACLGIAGKSCPGKSFPPFAAAVEDPPLLRRFRDPPDPSRVIESAEWLRREFRFGESGPDVCPRRDGFGFG